MGFLNPDDFLTREEFERRLDLFQHYLVECVSNVEESLSKRIAEARRTANDAHKRLNAQRERRYG